MGANCDELVNGVRLFEDLFNVEALDCSVAIFDEKGVGLPVFRTGATARCCEIIRHGYFERCCKSQGKEQEVD